jgi:hypothetical protein
MRLIAETIIDVLNAKDRSLVSLCRVKRGCDLLIFSASVQLAHQLRLSLGQAAGLRQFTDARAHPHQACCLGE